MDLAKLITMKLHTTELITVDSSLITIMRVPGGWLYHVAGNTVFVPLVRLNRYHQEVHQ